VKPKQPKKKSRKSLIKKADTVFSLWIRQRHAKNEMSECVTCGKVDHFKKLQAGHFMSRKFYSTRWDETNVQVQCAGCNVFRYGEQYKFSIWLESNIGQGTSEDLSLKSKQLCKLANFELEEIIEKFQNKLDNLK